MRGCPTWVARGLVLATIYWSLTGCTRELASYFEVLPVYEAYGRLRVQAELDRPFATRDHLTLRMDVFRRADTDAPTPVVVLIHGGFWVYGDRWYMHDWATDLAQQGYAAATVDYRLLSQGGQYPACVTDVLAAIAHLREHAAELNIDAERLALFGVSAGGHLALLAGLADDVNIFDPTVPAGESANVRAIVDIYGPTDFTADAETALAWQRQLLTSVLGCDQSDDPDRWREASPVTYARSDGPPVLILHGTADPIVPPSQAHALRDALEAAGQPCTFIEVADAGHFWGSMWYTGWVQRYRADILQFLEENLSGNDH